MLSNDAQAQPFLHRRTANRDWRRPGVSLGGAQLTGWSAIRPVLTGFLLAADAFVVAGLLISRRHGWLPPFIAFGSLLIGLVAFEAWAVRHRHDD